MVWPGSYLDPMTAVFILKIPRSITTYTKDGNVENAIRMLAPLKSSEELDLAISAAGNKLTAKKQRDRG